MFRKRRCTLLSLFLLTGMLAVEGAPVFASRAVSAPITGSQPDFSSGQPEALVVVGKTYSYQVVLAGTPPPTLVLTSGPAGMTWTADPLPAAGAMFAGCYATGTLTWTPAAAGQQPVVITASNSQGSATQAWTVRAVRAPIAPKIDGKTALKIMCLGDSITCGWGLASGGYRQPLGALLRGAGYTVTFVGGTKEGSPSWGNPPGAADLDHEGHGGWTTVAVPGQDRHQVAGLLSIVDGTYPHAGGGYAESATIIDTFQPDVVVLMIGTNDLGGTPDAGLWGITAEARIGALVDGIWARRPGTRIVVLPIVYNTVRGECPCDFWNVGEWEGVDRPGGGTMWVSRAQTGTAHLVTLRQRAGKPITFVDANRGAVDPRGWDPRKNASAGGMTQDGVHPVASAYHNALAQAAFRAILDVTPAALDNTVPPSAPSGLTATVRGTGMEVAWTANSRNEAAFEVDWSTSPVFATATTVQVAATTTATTLTGLPAAAPIYIRVRAKNPGGASWYAPSIRVVPGSDGGR